MFAKPLADDLEIDSALEGYRRVRVSEVVLADAWDAGPVDEIAAPLALRDRVLQSGAVAGANPNGKDSCAAQLATMAMPSPAGSSRVQDVASQATNSQMPATWRQRADGRSVARGTSRC